MSNTDAMPGLAFQLSDFTKLMSDFKVKDVDVSALVERERKNIEAFIEANRVAFEGYQSLVKRQTEIFRETMKAVTSEAYNEDTLQRRYDLTQQGFEKALANMSELAQMANAAQKQAYDVVRSRVEENVSETLRGSTKA